ncbi:hypothetical protein [Spiroplasma endosymbiont of Thecophora atra]
MFNYSLSYFFIPPWHEHAPLPWILVQVPSLHWIVCPVNEHR